MIAERLQNGSRFIANTPDDNSLMSNMTLEDYLGASGIVKNVEGVNIFIPD